MARIDRYKQHYRGGIYHIFNRGVDKKDIFIDQADYLYYLWKIRKYKKLYQVEFYSYSLLPNHYHYLIRQQSDIPITKFMHALHTSYVYYFNRKYKRVGPLYQDRYKQREVKNLNYFIWTSAYINGNAEVHNYVPSAKQWIFSSYLDFFDLRKGTLCNKQAIFSYFEAQNDYKKYVQQVIDNCKYKKGI